MISHHMSHLPAAQGQPNNRIVVAIATVGRPKILAETLRDLAAQSREPDAVIVCGTKPDDLVGAEQAYAGVQLLLEPQPGLPRQRNRLIDAAGDADLVVFFDDDFLPDRYYLQVIETAMVADRGIVVATGTVIADGINGPGLTPAAGREMIARHIPLPHTVLTPVFSGYGCNMTVRLDTVRQHGILFDPRLPLYGWQEDVDFSRRIAPFGKVVKLGAAAGVHLGVKSGRSSGIRLGYSQVANPLYLSRKQLGYPFRRALTHIASNMAMNMARFVRPEPHVDRRGRLRGNAIALRDLLLGRMTPERMLDL